MYLVSEVLKQIAFSAALLFAATASATLTHQYTFNDGTANDSVGGANGTLMGGATISGGQVHLDGQTGTYVNLPGPTIAINTYTDATFEGWFTLLPINNLGHWQRLFDFGTADNAGDSFNHYIFYAPTSQVNNNSDAVAEIGLWNPTSGFVLKTRASGGFQPEHFVAVVVDDNVNGGSGTMSVYVDGALASVPPGDPKSS